MPVKAASTMVSGFAHVVDKPNFSGAYYSSMADVTRKCKSEADSFFTDSESEGLTKLIDISLPNFDDPEYADDSWFQGLFRDEALKEREVGHKYKGAAESQGLKVFAHLSDVSANCTEKVESVGLPTRCASEEEVELLDDTTRELSSLNLGASSLYFANPPPFEVRTRTKNENRTFSCTVGVEINNIPQEARSLVKSASVKLVYARDVDTIVPILGGTLSRPLEKDDENVKVVFDDLSISAASPKHGEKEFSLRVSLDCAEKFRKPCMCAYSSPFYAYSHKSVLKRRREVELRAASHSTGSCSGGQKMHVVGTPFVRSDRLQCVFRLRTQDYEKLIRNNRSGSARIRKTVTSSGEWTSVRVDNMEFFSDSVLFFKTPTDFQTSKADVQTFIQVTNDGRNFSNSLPFLFKANEGLAYCSSDENLPPSCKRHRIMSRM